MTMEQMIEALERKGWRLSSLSHIAGPRQYSCILERKKLGEDGFPVYASSEIRETPSAALAEAWENAQKPIENKRVFRKVGVTPELPALSKWLADHVGYRVALEDALQALVYAHTGKAEEDDEYV